MKDKVLFVVNYISHKRHAYNNKDWRKTQNVIQITQVLFTSIFAGPIPLKPSGKIVVTTC
jgi:hypothetical protein